MTDPNSNDGESLDLNTLATISVPYKVLGRLPDTDGIGVVGNSTATSGGGIGVKGIAEANPGEEGSSIPTGVVGETTSTTGDTRGVAGFVDSKGGEALYGEATNTSGFANALKAKASGGGNAIVADGDVNVRGRLTVTDLGVSVYRGSAQGIGNSLETVVYDKTVLTDGGSFDTSTGKFTANLEGAYQIEAQVQWSQVPSGGDKLVLVIQVDNGVSIKEVARTVDYLGSDAYTDLTVEVSKTVRLFDGDEAYVQARHGGSGDKDIAGGESKTYLTVTKVG